MANELLESDKLRLFLLLDGTLIHDNEYLESLENATELIYTDIYFQGSSYKHYLSTSFVQSVLYSLQMTLNN